MKKISILTDGIKDVRMDSLKENIECDILVIGEIRDRETMDAAIETS